MIDFNNFYFIPLTVAIILFLIVCIRYIFTERVKCVTITEEEQVNGFFYKTTKIHHYQQFYKKNLPLGSKQYIKTDILKRSNDDNVFKIVKLCANTISAVLPYTKFSKFLSTFQLTKILK